VYSEFASVFYDRRITKANIEERFVGKTVILSLGYSSGWKKLKTTLYLGNGGVPVVVSDAEAERLVRLYRDTFSEIPGLWRIAGEALRRMAGLPTRANLPDLPVVAYAYDGRCMINLPNGMALRYPNLRQNTDAETGQIELVYDFPPHGWKRIYGAKLIENITQALARIVITDVELRVWRETGYRPFLSTYDSHDWIVAASEVHAFDKIITTQFAAAPTWAPGLVLSSEGGWGKTLLQAEHHINE
jgi:DNA polymerase